MGSSSEFIKNVKKLHSKKKFLVTNSYGTEEVWRWLKKNKWLSVKQYVTTTDFGAIIKSVDKAIVDKLLTGSCVHLPHKMGRLELSKTKRKVKIEDGKITTNLPVDWPKTLQYWYEDKEARENKTLLWCEWDYIFNINYYKYKESFINSVFYKFTPARSFKNKMIEKIKNNELETFTR